MIHVGMDIHHTNSYVRAIDAEGRVLPGKRIYHNDMMALWQYLEPFKGQPKRLVFEATANSRWMQRLLGADPSIEPVAVTPHKVRIIAETVAKTDKIDATVLAQLSQMNALPRAWLPDEQQEALRELVRHRASLVRLRTRAKNRINGVLIRQGIVRPLGDIFGPLGREWLATVELQAVMRLQVDHWLTLIDAYNERMVALEQRLYQDLARRDRWHKDVALLQSMPGVGRLTALVILAELGDYRRFHKRSEVSGFAGLVPTSKRSDRSSRYGRISKRGPTLLRSILVEAAPHAVRKVPRYETLYRRLRTAKGANVGKVAVARQMLEDAWTMLIKQEPFRYEAKQVEPGAGRMKSE